jgi:hypothetical protein
LEQALLAFAHPQTKQSKHNRKDRQENELKSAACLGTYIIGARSSQASHRLLAYAPAAQDSLGPICPPAFAKGANEGDPAREGLPSATRAGDYHDVGTARNAFCGNEKSLDGGMLLPVRCCRMRGNSGCQQEVELMV